MEHMEHIEDMENIQVNGQRRWGPPNNWTGPLPPHGTEVFIKNLPEDVFEVELFNTFSCAGPIYEVRLPIHWTGLNRGYAFVRYTKTSDASIAIKTFNMFSIRPDKKIKVERSVDNTSLFISAVPKDKTSKQLMKDLSEVVENVKRVCVYPTLENRSEYRGYAFVEFETHRDAAIAKRALNSDICSGLFGKKSIAAWATPPPFLEDEDLQKVRNLFIRNIPNDIKPVHLRKAIENLIGFDQVRRIKQTHDYAFVTFKTHEIAEHSLEILKSSPLVISGVELQIEWAIPKEKAKSNDNSVKDISVTSRSSFDGYSSEEDPFVNSENHMMSRMMEIHQALLQQQNLRSPLRLLTNLGSTKPKGTRIEDSQCCSPMSFSSMSSTFNTPSGSPSPQLSFQSQDDLFYCMGPYTQQACGYLQSQPTTEYNFWN